MDKAVKLIIVGSVAHDTYSTPFGKVAKILGGAAVHAGMVARYFAPSVGLVGVVGEDFHEKHLRLLRSKGIDLEGLRRSAGQTFHWTGKYEGDMSVAQTLNTELGVFATFDPVLPESYRQAEFLFLANIDPTIQFKVLGQVRKPKFTLLDTMNYWIGGKKAELLKVLRRVDAVILNDQEVRLLTGKTNLVHAATAARKLGPRWVIVKKGEHGAALFGGSDIFQIGAYPVAQVKDPTGAGDSFAGGFIGSLAKAGRVDRASLRQAMAIGTCMASFNVEDFSIRRTHGLKAQEIRGRLAALKQMAAF